LQLAVSETEGETKFTGSGGGSAIAETASGTIVKVTTLDRFVETNKIPRVDFIKMDVEGHELKVLEGAHETIKTSKPSLALSAYHCGDDFIKLPKLLLELNPDYKFYLRHCSPSWAETVLTQLPTEWNLHSGYRKRTPLKNVFPDLSLFTSCNEPTKGETGF